MAGPWFTVHESDPETWHPLGGLWLSNGTWSGPGTAEFRIWFEDPEDDDGE